MDLVDRAFEAPTWGDRVDGRIVRVTRSGDTLVYDTDQGLRVSVPLTCTRLLTMSELACTRVLWRKQRIRSLPSLRVC